MSSLERLAGRRVVASISGGKDSAALSLWLTENGIEHDRVFLDTGWEHASTYDYLRGPLTKAIGPIIERKAVAPNVDLSKIRRPRVRAAAEAGNAMVLVLLSKAMFPSRVIRFCTQTLKVEPMKLYLNSRVAAGDDLINAVGIRHAESEARSKLSEWEWSDGFDCEVWRPLIAWSEQDVINAHTRHALRPNPLYLLGASRVGCWPCIYARKSEIKLLASDPERVALIAELEEELTERATERAAAKGEELRWQRTWFQQGSGRARDEVWTIDRALDWARTSRGGRQFELFDAGDSDAGCMRWGLCETKAPERE